MDFIIKQASTFASDIDDVILVIALLGGFWLIVAEGVFFYFVFKYKRKNGTKAQYLSGETHQEKKWIHWPHNVIILCDLVVIFFAVKVWYNVKQDLPPAEETIQVIGQQWAWTFVHPGADKQLGTEDDVAIVDELHLKKDTTYHYNLESKDVLHSFSIPVFRLKQDAIPGRVITGWFRPTVLGAYDFQCAEMCGIGHGIMGARVYVETAEQHDAWLQQQTKGG